METSLNGWLRLKKKTHDPTPHHPRRHLPFQLRPLPSIKQEALASWICLEVRNGEEGVEMQDNLFRYQLFKTFKQDTMSEQFGSDSLWLWIVKKSAVNNPYKKYWSAAVTLGGIDIYGKGSTIQAAYKALYKKIESSQHLFKAYANL